MIFPRCHLEKICPHEHDSLNYIPEVGLTVMNCGLCGAVKVIVLFEETKTEETILSDTDRVDSNRGMVSVSSCTMHN